MYQSIAMPEFDILFRKEKVNVIDVRESFEHAYGHIEDAILMPLATIPLQIEQLDMSQKYYVICQSGMRSAQASAYLSKAGYDVVNIMGGMSAWRGETVYFDLKI
ncbi:MAG: hypothetical protein K0R71_801 [Bacillales bacterium]|jgi:rhodanese-related sulfurtransferase|nr:hypothetical protein [Bacillales bacterium]